MKRNSFDISADILRISQSGAKKTHLVYKANLNFKIVKKYLNSLIINGLLEYNGNWYHITDKGSKFLEKYDALIPPLSVLD